MLDSYDMQMLDYPSDLDIQMHPSSSDQWFQDESKMEEDGPSVVKPENPSFMRTDGQLPMRSDSYLPEDTEITIEVDMESYADEYNVEYEMLDDEENRHAEFENLDVEVYDVSVAQSPSMLPASVSESGDQGTVDLSTQTDNSLPSTSPHVHHESSEPHFFAVHSDNNSKFPSEAESYGTGNDAEHGVALSTPVEYQSLLDEETHDFLEPLLADMQPEERKPEEGGANLPEDASLGQTEPVDADHEQEEIASKPQVAADDDVYDTTLETPEQTEGDVQGGSANSTGDPHEISEGVYIDPPPPVLLSIASADQFDLSLFNEPSASSIFSETSSPTHHTPRVVLQHLPTLYYEPLSSVFEALRQDQIVQSLSIITDGELVLDAVDLQLILSEDNIYAREVSLHDLNVLHDASGIHGLLRMRLYTSTPRFIVRYHTLQEQIGRLNLDQQSATLSEGLNGLDQSNQQDPDQREIQTETRDADQEQANEPDNGSERNEPDNGLERNEPDEPLIQPVSEAEPESHEYENEEEENKLSYDDDVEDPSHQSHEDGDPGSPKVSAEVSDVQHNPYDRSTTTASDVYSRLGEDVSPTTEGNVIALDAVEADWDDQSFNDEEEQQSEDSDHPSRDVSTSHAEGEEALETNLFTDNGTEILEALETVEPDGTTETWKETLDNHTSVTSTEMDPATAEDEIENLESFNEHNLNGETHVENEENEDKTGDFEITDVPELPTEPIVFDGENWEDDLDGEGDLDVTWEHDNENTLSTSNESSVTLSSKASKRSYDEVDSDGDEAAETGLSPPSSPGPKRSRTQ
ncbi:hypothetical protein B0H34DRAFT_694191 [Crassisporium funariophilum]|nr:hypothetical protein B0H34DRAFT_694191 [Crassisporium funariophilum]